MLASLSLHFQETPLSVSISKKLVDIYQKSQGTPEMADRLGLDGFAHCTVLAKLGTLMRCSMNCFPPWDSLERKSRGISTVPELGSSSKEIFHTSMFSIRKIS